MPPDNYQQPIEANNLQSPASPPVLEPQFAPSSSRKPKRKKLALLVIVAVVFLAGASAAAYFAATATEKPEDALKTAFNNTLRKRQVSAKGTLSYENTAAEQDSLRAINITFETQSDSDNHTFAADMEVAASGVKLPVELRSVGKNFYVKVGSLGSLKGAVQLSNPDLVPLIDEVDEKIANQWIEIDNSLIKEANAQCLLEYPASLTEEDFDLLANSYNGNEFIAVKSTAEETVEGSPSTRYDVTIDEAKAKSYGKNLENLSVFKNFKDCIEQVSRDPDFLDELEEESPDESETSEYSLWVDTATQTINQVKIKGSDKESTADLVINLSYDNVAVNKPDDARPLLEVIGELAPLLQQVLGGNLTPPDSQNANPLQGARFQ